MESKIVDEQEQLATSVMQLRSALKGLEDARTMMLAVEETFSRNKILELRQQIRLSRLEAAQRGHREIERLYRQCEEILAGSQPARIAGDLLQVRDRLQSTLDFFSGQNKRSRPEESHQAVGRC